MAAIQHNSRLNEFVVAIGHSLLQYADECWPWVNTTDADAHVVIHRLAALQRQEVATLVELLMQRERIIDFGTFPTDYTDLQFLSLDYLLARIIAGEQILVADLDEAVHACVDDAAAADVLRELLTTQRKILERLESLAKSRVAGAAVN